MRADVLPRHSKQRRDCRTHEEAEPDRDEDRASGCQPRVVLDRYDADEQPPGNRCKDQKRSGKGVDRKDCCATHAAGANAGLGARRPRSGCRMRHQIRAARVAFKPVVVTNAAIGQPVLQRVGSGEMPRSPVNPGRPRLRRDGRVPATGPEREDERRRYDCMFHISPGYDGPRR
jgi:hypothetical protein